MTQDDIIRMAREAGIQPVDRPRVEKFAELVASAEREACAQVCDQEQSQWNADRDGWQSAKDCAAAIRARGEKGNV